MCWLCWLLLSLPAAATAQSWGESSSSDSSIADEVAELEELLEAGRNRPTEPMDRGITDWELSSESGFNESLDAFAPALLHGRHGIWVRADSLLWWSSGFAAPPLATTSPVGTPAENAGVIGQDTLVLMPNDGIVDGLHMGGRLAVAKWLGRRELVAVEGVLTAMDEIAVSWSANSDAFPILARPYFDQASDLDAAMLAAYPGMMAGGVRVDATSRFLAAEGLLRMIFVEMDEARIDLLAGYRHQRLDESLAVSQDSFWPEAQPPILAGTTREVSDLFDTCSRFDGVEVGLMYETRFWRCALGLNTKVAFGKNRSTLGIDGSTVTTVPGAEPAVFEGGLLAQRTNMGEYQWEEFSVVTDVGVFLSCYVTDRLKGVLGYSVLYWPNVARPDNQVDLSLSQLPPESATGANHPTPVTASSDYWLQGIRFGIELDY